MTEIDDDLQGLLEELDIGPEISTDIVSQAPTPSPPISQSVVPEPTSKKLLPPPPPPPPPILEDPKPIVEEEEKADTDLFKEENKSEQQGLIDIREFISNHNKDYEEAKCNLRTDRAKADELVRILMERVDGNDATGQETESLVQSIKCLVDSNGHMVRLLDSRSKLLSATKSSASTLIQQNFGDKSSSELEEMLTQKVDQDEV